jgi:hypothetical protein
MFPGTSYDNTLYKVHLVSPLFVPAGLFTLLHEAAACWWKREATPVTWDSVSFSCLRNSDFRKISSNKYLENMKYLAIPLRTHAFSGGR